MRHGILRGTRLTVAADGGLFRDAPYSSEAPTWVPGY